MKALIFVGSLDTHPTSISAVISDYIKAQLITKGVAVTVFNLSESKIPILELKNKEVPDGVKKMTDQFLSADLHFWLSPLYHGSIPGVMKNCLDWLEVTTHLPKPYLTDKVIGLICWADGSQALNGISTMENIAKSLRAWSVPYTLPIVKKDFFNPIYLKEISSNYSEKLDRLIQISISREVSVIEV